MTMCSARLLLVLVGVLLPYAARLPLGIEWLQQYTPGSLGAWLLLQAFNTIAWGAILSISFMYFRPVSVLAPCLLGFGFVA